MKAEHWSWGPDDEYGGCEGLDPVGTPELDENKKKVDQIMREMYGDTGKYCCTIEGKNWTEIQQKYHQHMGWGEYRPPPGAEET
jgi:hypothetical protein